MMKRFHVALFSCLALAGSTWLAHVVWAQAAETSEKSITITKSQFEKLVAERVSAALADRKDKPASDEDVRRPENWHIAIFNKAEYVIYTGPGQFMFHHWVENAKPAMPKTSATPPRSGTATPPAGSGR